MSILYEIKRCREGQEITSVQLLRLCDIKSAGTLRDIIHKLRVEGEPIIGNKNGYWYCNDPMKVIKLSEKLINRGIATIVGGSGMRKGAIRRINAPDLFSNYKSDEDIIREAME
ncbi:MAG: hypothetical protein ACE5D6_04615 [Candidatus Zixiibacteriota bacterium]